MTTEEGRLVEKKASYSKKQKAMNSTVHSFPNAGGAEVSLQARRATYHAFV